MVNGTSLHVLQLYDHHLKEIIITCICVVNIHKI